MIKHSTKLPKRMDPKGQTNDDIVVLLFDTSWLVWKIRRPQDLQKSLEKHLFHRKNVFLAPVPIWLYSIILFFDTKGI